MNNPYLRSSVSDIKSVTNEVSRMDFNMANAWNWKALAVASGTLMGAWIFFAALFQLGNVSFWWFNPTVWLLLAATFPGVSATLTGAVIGLVWGFACGAVCGGVTAALYNWANKRWK